eukprot:363330-Chlamydomonas_euryale.AAC.5
MKAPCRRNSATHQQQHTCAVVSRTSHALPAPACAKKRRTRPPCLQVTAALRDFLTSATIKDCGVMVAMQRLAVDPQQAEQLTAQATDS